MIWAGLDSFGMYPGLIELDDMEVLSSERCLHVISVVETLLHITISGVYRLFSLLPICCHIHSISGMCQINPQHDFDLHFNDS